MSGKASFFHMDQFHGVDLRPLYEDVMLENFRQPCVEQINPVCLVGEPSTKVCARRKFWFVVVVLRCDGGLFIFNLVDQLFDYSQMAASDLHVFEIPFSLVTPHATEVSELP